jgi:hypothetical protein
MVQCHLANHIEYFQGRKTEGFEEERVALKKEVKRKGRGSTRGRRERPSIFLQRDMRAPATVLALVAGLIVGPVLAAGPVGKGIAGGVTESHDEVANGRTTLAEAFDQTGKVFHGAMT